MKNNKVIKSGWDSRSNVYFDLIMKKECPEGEHAHPGYVTCHPLDKPHKAGTSADEFHKANGIPNTWFEKHGTTREQWEKENEGARKPYTKRNPGEEPEKKPRRKKEPKEGPAKEPEVDDGKIKPYGKGLTKPEGLDHIMGFTRKKLEKQCPEYMEFSHNNAKRYREAFDKIDWSKVTMDTVQETVEEFMADALFESKKRHATGSFKDLSDEKIRASIKQWSCMFDFSRYPVHCAKTTLECLVAVGEEYPFALETFSGFGTTWGTGVEAWSSRDKTILFNHGYYARSKEPFDDDLETVIDPLTKNKEQWSFHFQGSTFGNCIQHEFGHLIDTYVTQMVADTMVKTEGDGKSVANYGDMAEKWTKAFSELEQYGFDEDDFDYNSETGEFYLTTGWRKSFGSNYKSSLRAIFSRAGVKNIEKIEEDYSYATGTSTYVIKLKPEKTKAPEAQRKKHDKPDGTWEKDTHYVNEEKDPQQAQIRVDRIKECEEVYKQLYNLKTFSPTDVYSAYGYYGRSSYWKEGKKALTKSLQAGERVAEAFQDVMVRKDKANSMSQLIVAHFEYEIYQCKTGDYSKSFKDFVLNDVTKDRFKERIIKRKNMEYILFNSIVKNSPISKRCPPGYHSVGGGMCGRLIDGKPIGEKIPENQPRQSNTQGKPKKKDPVLNEEFNKIVSPDSKEGKIVTAMKDGKSDDAVQSRKNYINMAKELGYYPVVVPIPNKFKSYGATFDGTRTTYDTFVSEDGKYAPARKRLHDKIIGKYMRNMKFLDGDKQIAMFLGGGSASGKGSMNTTLLKDFGIKFNPDDDEDIERAEKILENYKIDPDAIMEQLPEYKRLPPELRASACHREASDIAEELFYLAMKEGVSFIYDGTFSSEKPVRFAKSVDKGKYNMLYRGIVADPEGCVFFSNKRFVGGGDSGIARLVPESIIRETNKGAREIRKKYDMRELFDDPKVFKESDSRFDFYKKHKDTFFK